MNLSEAAKKVIDLAGKVYQYYDTELPKWHRNYPLVEPDEESPPPPPEEKALRDFLSSLPEEILYQLLLITYLGRGDCDTDDLAEYYASFRGAPGGPEYALAELMGEAALADELSYGLEELRKHRINVDKIALRKVKVRKQ
jgi:hypothetical protein